MANPHPRNSPLLNMKVSLSLASWSANPFGQDITTVVMGAAPVVDSKVLQQSELRQTLRTKDTHGIPVSCEKPLQSLFLGLGKDESYMF